MISLHENWIIIRAGELNNDPATSVYRVEDKIPKGGKISRDDLARWIVKNLGSHGDKWIGKTPSICY